MNFITFRRRMDMKLDKMFSIGMITLLAGLASFLVFVNIGHAQEKGIPMIEVMPDSFDLAITTGDTLDTTFTISNTGCCDLIFDIDLKDVTLAKTVMDKFNFDFKVNEYKTDGKNHPLPGNFFFETNVTLKTTIFFKYDHR